MKQEIAVILCHLDFCRFSGTVSTPNSISKGAAGAQIYSQGYSVDRLQSYLEYLSKICHWVIDNHYDQIDIA